MDCNIIITSITKICRLPHWTNTLAQLSVESRFTLLILKNKNICMALNPCKILFFNQAVILIFFLENLELSTFKNYMQRHYTLMLQWFLWAFKLCVRLRHTSILGQSLKCINRISLFAVNYNMLYMGLVVFTTGNANKCACSVIHVVVK